MKNRSSAAPRKCGLELIRDAQTKIQEEAVKILVVERKRKSAP